MCSTLFSRHLFNVIAYSVFATLLFSSHATAADNVLHLSLTEADYDRSQGRIHLRVRLQTDALEAVLSERTQHKISIADLGELSPAALAYLREKLQFQSAKDQPLRLEWAGIDVTEKHIFLFFEAPLNGNIQGLRITNTILLERFPDQINSVELHDGALKQTLVFAHDTRQLTVRAAP